MKRRNFRKGRESGPKKSATFCLRRSLLAFLLFGIIVLAPLPAFAYDPPTDGLEVEVVLEVDIQAYLWIDYTGDGCIQFEVDWSQIDDLEDGSVQVQTEDDLLWCVNGDWWIDIFRSDWEVVGDVGDPNLELWIEYRYQEDEGESGGQFTQITTTPTKIEEGAMGCFAIYDFDWKIKKLSIYTTHKGNYTCTVYFELWDP